MSKQSRPWTPEQTFVRPPSHVADFVREVVRELDLGAIEAAIQQKDPRGERSYAPKRMTLRRLGSVR